MVRNYSGQERKPAAINNWAISEPVLSTIPDRIAHTMAFVNPIVVHWLELKSLIIPQAGIDLMTHKSMNRPSTMAFYQCWHIAEAPNSKARLPYNIPVD